MDDASNSNTDIDFQNAILGSVPINTTFAHNVYKALEQYRKDKGLPFLQDVVRLLVASGLSKAGYLNNNS